MNEKTRNQISLSGKWNDLTTICTLIILYFPGIRVIRAQWFWKKVFNIHSGLPWRHTYLLVSVTQEIPEWILKAVQNHPALRVIHRWRNIFQYNVLHLCITLCRRIKLALGLIQLKRNQLRFKLLTAYLPPGLRRWFFKTAFPTPTRALPSSLKL